MGLLDRIGSALVRKSVSAGDHPWLTLRSTEGWGIRDNHTGVNVNATNMLEVTTAWACIRLISETIGTLPLNVYKRNANGGRIRQRAHAVDQLLSTEPSPGILPIGLKESLGVSLASHNMAYMLPTRVPGSGRIIGLRPVPAAAVEPITRSNHRDSHDRWRSGSAQQGAPEGYRVHIDGEWREYKRGELIPIAGWGSTGHSGLSPFQTHRNALGLALAADEYAARYFGQSAMPGAVLECDGILNEPKRLSIRKAWALIHKGLANQHEIAILEGGMRFKRVQSNLQESQAIEVRNMQVREVARIWRVPPHLVNDMDKATFNNVEQQNRHFLQHTLSPYLKRMEEAFTLYLLTDAEKRAGYYIEFNPDAMLMADAKTRAETQRAQIQGGMLTPNEARAQNNMPPIAGGDQLYMQQQMVPLDKLTALHDKDS